MGEGPKDLHEFNASAFVEALLGTDNDEIAA
jgi:signal recognition particle GTPase